MIGDIEDKGIITIVQDELKSVMHYAESDSRLYSLTLKDTEKVKKLESDRNVKVTFAKDKKTIDAVAEIIDDRSIVRDFYDRMNELKFNYFKEYSEELVIIEMKPL